jgi:hypothetical protein
MRHPVADKGQRARTIGNRYAFVVLSLLCLSAIRCSKAIPLAQLALIEIPTSRMVIPVGGNQSLTALAKDERGNTLGEINFTWTSTHPGIASVSGNIVYGQQVGISEVTASAGGLVSLPIEVKVVFAHEGPFSVTGLEPLNQFANIGLSPTVKITFNRQVDQATVNDATYSLTGPEGKVPGTIQYDPDTWSLSFIPASPLNRRTPYTAVATTGLKDEVGNSLPSDFSWSFITEGVNGSPPPVHFSAPNLYKAGEGAYNIAVADFNQDSHADMAVVNTESNFISVRFGDGKGGFSPATDIVTGAGTHGIAAGDLNGDGLPDLVVTNLGLSDVGGDTVTVLLNQSSAKGTFVQAEALTAGDDPAYAALGDFNEDGKLDLVVANERSNDLSIFLGDGLGGFGPPTHYSSGLKPHSVVLGDIDGDEHLDLVSSHRIGGDISLFRGDGKGTFAPAVHMLSGVDAHSVTLGDFNEDGKPDLAVEFQFEDRISVLLNRSTPGNLAFAAQVNYRVGIRPAFASVADMNLDGHLDLVVANNATSDATVLLGDGTGYFSPPASFPAGAGAHSAVLADFNEDGYPDIVTGNQSTIHVAVLLSEATIPFVKSDQILPATLPRSIVSGDFNHDGQIDLAATHYLFDQGRFSFYAGNNLYLEAETTTLIPHSLSLPWMGKEDFNGDGNEDLAMIDDRTNELYIYWGDGRGEFVSGPVVSVNNGPTSGLVVDLDGDGHPDIITVNQGDGTLSLLYNRWLTNPTSHFDRFDTQTVPVGADPQSVAAGDWNNDGQKDLAVTHLSTNQVSIWRGPGWTPDQQITVPGPKGIVTGEFTGDGFQDLAVARFSDATVQILQGDGAGGFAALATDLITEKESGFLLSGDFNQDGRLDLAIPGEGFPVVSILFGKTGGGFQPTQHFRVGDASRALAMGDFNQDGLPDLAVAESAGNVISFLLGKP